MTADEILRRVERAKSTAELAALAPEIGARERAIRARLAEIVDPQSAAVDPPPERRAAIAAGVDAVVKLEDEIRRLSIEVDLLARYEATLIQQQRELRRDELLASIPRACKSLPGRLAEARRALEGLDAALAALRETVAAIGEYSAAELPLPRTHVHVTPTSGYERVMVKWFNRLRGFGFVTPDDGGQDVFLHSSVLQRAGKQDVQQGEKVALDVRDGQRGRQAVTIK